MNYDEWVARAVNIITQQLPIGQIFELKQLFPGHEWDTLSKGERISLGIHFSRCVNEGKILNVTRFENGKTRHNRYLKQIGGNTNE